MKYVICSIRDQVADVFSVPQFVPSIGQAVRAFTDEVNRIADNNILSRHPDDFALFHIGDYDDSSGKCVSCEPRQLILGKEAKRAG